MMVRKAASTSALEGFWVSGDSARARSSAWTVGLMGMSLHRGDNDREPIGCSSDRKVPRKDAVRPGRRRAPSAGHGGLHQATGLAEVHLPGIFALEHAHDLAHVLHAGGAGFLDGGCNR